VRHPGKLGVELVNPLVGAVGFGCLARPLGADEGGGFGGWLVWAMRLSFAGSSEGD
jgi:hypothetical protein